MLATLVTEGIKVSLSKKSFFFIRKSDLFKYIKRWRVFCVDIKGKREKRCTSEKFY